MAELPVIAAAANFVTATRRFPSRAAMMTRVDSLLAIEVVAHAALTASPRSLRMVPSSRRDDSADLRGLRPRVGSAPHAVLARGPRAVRRRAGRRGPDAGPLHRAARRRGRPRPPGRRGAGRFPAHARATPPGLDRR